MSQVQRDARNTIAIVQIGSVVSTIVTSRVLLHLSCHHEVGSDKAHLMLHLSHAAKLVVEWVSLLPCHGIGHARVDLFESLLARFSHHSVKLKAVLTSFAEVTLGHTKHGEQR